MIQATYNRVYGNVDFLRYGKIRQGFTRINWFRDLKKITYSDTQGLFVLDEAANNASQYSYMSKGSSILTELLTLGRKRRLDFLILPQDDEMTLKNIRRLTYMHIALKQPRYAPGGNFALFNAKVQKPNEWPGEPRKTLKYAQYDLIGFQKRTGFWFDTLEVSKMIPEVK